MDEFVERIKQSANKVIDGAEKFTNAAVTKTGNMVNQTKLNYAIGVNEGKIKDILAEIGKSVFDEYKNGSEVPEDIAEKLKIVDTMYDEIAELKAKIADMKNSVICPECGVYNSNDSVYCSKCGIKIK